MKYVKAKKQNYLWMIIIFSSPIWHFIVYKAFLHVTCTANFLGRKILKIHLHGLYLITVHREAPLKAIES